MDNFLITLTTVALMLAYAAPGFLVVKTKLVKEESISAFAFVLMYICQPCLVIYSFNQVDFSKSVCIEMIIAFAVIFAVITTFIFIFFFLFKKKATLDNKYRIFTMATAFPNCAFFGIPILESLLPDHPEVIAFSTVYFVVMNIIGWTIGCYVITGDKKYMKVKKIVLNPAVLSLLVAIPLFIFKIKLGDGKINTFFTTFAKMTTPLCMLIMGMRLATTEIKPIFANLTQYIICIIKQSIFPLFMLLCMWFIPTDVLSIPVKQAIYIMSCCPVAIIIQTYAEMLGHCQKEAVNTVLLSTISCIITMPLMMLIPIFN